MWDNFRGIMSGVGFYFEAVVVVAILAVGGAAIWAGRRDWRTALLGLILIVGGLGFLIAKHFVTGEPRWPGLLFR